MAGAQAIRAQAAAGLAGLLDALQAAVDARDLGEDDVTLDSLLGPSTYRPAPCITARRYGSMPPELARHPETRRRAPLGSTRVPSAKEET